MEFKDKTAVITGGASGIGFALAKRLSQSGAHVILFEPDEDALKTAAAQLVETGGEARYFVGDVTDAESVEALAEFAWDGGRADILINNAGVGGPFQK